MALVAVGSVKGAPGATALVVLLAWAWPRPVVLVEADPAGGVLVARFPAGPDGFGLRAEPGLVELAAIAARGGSDEALFGAMQALGPAWVVPAPVSAEQVAAALRHGGAELGRRFRALAGVDVVVDVGRVWQVSPVSYLASSAERLLLVTRPTVAECVVVRDTAEWLATAGPEVGLVCVGSTPYRPEEAAAVAGLPLVAALPSDARRAGLAAGESGSEKDLRRSALWREVAALARTLAGPDYRAGGTGSSSNGQAAERPAPLGGADGRAEAAGLSNRGGGG